MSFCGNGVLVWIAVATVDVAARAKTFGLAIAIWFAILPTNTAQAARSFVPHSGYIVDATQERDERYHDLVIKQPPATDGPTLQELIFNDKLSKEFRDRYEYTFGRTDVEREYNSPNRFTYYDDIFGFKGTPQQMNAERRKFGDFMIRRLAEFHVDNYAKSDPTVRPVWEAKEKLSNIRVEVQQVRFDLNYSISGNTFDLRMVNPWLSLTRFRLQMDPGSIGPSNVEELLVSLGKKVTSTFNLDTHYYLYDGIVSLVGTKTLTTALSCSMTASTFFLSSGKARRESLYLAGLSYRF